MSKGSWLFLSAIYIKEYKHQIKCNQHGRKENVGLKAAKKQNGQKGQRRVPAEGQEAKASTHTSTFEYPPLRSSYETHAYVHIHMRNSQPVITVLHAYSIYCTESLQCAQRSQHSSVVFGEFISGKVTNVDVL